MYTYDKIQYSAFDIKLPKLYMHQSEWQQPIQQIVITQTGIALKGLTLKGIARKDITLKVITLKGITRKGITREASRLKAWNHAEKLGIRRGSWIKPGTWNIPKHSGTSRNIE